MKIVLLLLAGSVLTLLAIFILSAALLQKACLFLDYR